MNNNTALSFNFQCIFCPSLPLQEYMLTKPPLTQVVTMNSEERLSSSWSKCPWNVQPGIRSNISEIYPICNETNSDGGVDSLGLEFKPPWAMEQVRPPSGFRWRLTINQIKALTSNSIKLISMRRASECFEFISLSFLLIPLLTHY